ncbi:MAG: adenylosuccinate synthetase, partial [Dehalococcoidales bacterium]|nr:adenylosuccinate synthetase [Dehalococcoidales bacterium]
MTLRIIVGVNWGDEGKGRCVDYFARNADYVIRYQGGNNAGHTIENDFGNFKLHLVPSGIFYPGVINLLGPGTVVNLEAAVKEMNDLRARGVKIDQANYKISDRAVITFPFHVLQDEYEESRLAGDKFGSTKQGIAPVYGDRYMKYGIPVGALMFPQYLKKEIERCLDFKNAIFEKVYGKPAVNPAAMYDWATKWGEILKPHIVDTFRLFKEDALTNPHILLEG